jgi:2-isopropylmalate synthase
MATLNLTAHTDTMVASIRAYVNALNKLMIRREKSAPKPMQAAG